MGKHHMRKIAGKEHEQSRFGFKEDTVRHVQKGGAAAGTGIPQMQRRTAVRIERFAGIHILGT